MIRCFVAVSFPQEVIEEIARIQEIVAKKNFTGKLTELKNIHLTLKFLGEIEEDLLTEVKKELALIKFEKMELKLGEVGTFALYGNPRIVWLKVEGQTLWNLQERIDSAMRKIGFTKEERFMAHITIARVKYVEDRKGFREYIKNIKSKKISFNVDQFQLKKSDLKKIDLIYEDLEVYKSSRAEI